MFYSSILVRAYGTENREAQTFISGSNKVYGKVEFRADDIKEFALVGKHPSFSVETSFFVINCEQKPHKGHSFVFL